MKVVIGDTTTEQDNHDFVCDNLERLVMIPGCGEGALSDTKSIDEAKQSFPKLKSCGIPVSWFIDNLNISQATVKPGVEKRESSDNWHVGNYNRANAHKIYQENESPDSLRYGGTMPDSDVINYIKELNSRSIEVLFYPFVMVDVEGKPWRGKITGKPEDVEDFFENQYNPFILHYANLLKGKVNAFLMGSELGGLTSIMTTDYKFPFVDKLIKLASEVRTILGDKVKISYAANWDEYHATDGGFRPLDKFWADSNINFVGIDAYFPLTDTTESKILVEEIRKGWKSGEGVDYYYVGNTKLTFSGPWAQWKNLKFWYENDHYDWNPVTYTSTKTPWEGKSKKIWLTEYGFRSIDKATNTPHLFDANPKHSTGAPDNAIQVAAIRATIEFIENTDFIDQGFCYGYDTIGNNWQKKTTPSNELYYADSQYWQNGHWIDGKIGKK